ncbi:hypothetical protein [Methylocella tundrae]|uniref:hypothetical protein n=1 Tax=Methylocella tundrae TaxID=227605 RepID=UPI001FCF090D|nr:hypothetical protein [Methylocella tundrae]
MASARSLGEVGRWSRHDVEAPQDKRCVEGHRLEAPLESVGDAIIGVKRRLARGRDDLAMQAIKHRTIGGAAEKARKHA